MADPFWTLCSTIRSDKERKKLSEKPNESGNFDVFFDSLVEGVSKLKVKERSDTLDTAATSESASTASSQPSDLKERDEAESSEEDDWSFDSQPSQFWSEVGDDLFDNEAYFLDETEFSRGLEGYGCYDEDCDSGEFSYNALSMQRLPFHRRPSTVLYCSLTVIVEERSFESA